MQSAANHFLRGPRGFLKHIELGKLTERVLCDTRLDPIAKVFTLLVAYLGIKRGGVVGLEWAEIEEWMQVPRGKIYWAASQKGKRYSRDCPREEARKAGYIDWRYEEGRGCTIYKIVVDNPRGGDQQHQGGDASDQGGDQQHQGGDASDQGGDQQHQGGDASDQGGDQQHQGGAIPTSTQPPITTQEFGTVQNRQNEADFPEERKKEKILKDPDQDQERIRNDRRNDQGGRGGISTGVDNPDDVAPLTIEQVTMWRRIWKVKGVPHAVTENMIRTTVREARAGNITPQQVVKLHKGIQPNNDAKAWPERFLVGMLELKAENQKTAFKGEDA